MKSKNQVSGFLAGLGALVAVTAGVAHADVTTQRQISIQGVGAMAVANISGTTTTAVSGNKSRTDSDLRPESKIVRFLARNAVGPTADIVDLDADKTYHLNVNKKEYTEQSFEEIRNKLQNAVAGSNSANSQGDDRRAQPSAIDQSKCVWLEPKADVKRTGEKATLAGFEAERVVITAEQPCKDKETGAICEIALTLDDWMAPGLGNNEELARYTRAYAQKMGFDSTVNQDSTERAKAMFAQYPGAWSQVIDKMKDLKGYPVKSSFALALGGEQCKQAQGAQQPSDSGGDNSSSSSDSPSDIAGKVGAKLGSFFHKKQDDSQPQTAATPPPATGPAGTITLMTVTTELVSVSTSSIPAEAFAVPAGYKKVAQ
jgi:hypothetical protein